MVLPIPFDDPVISAILFIFSFVIFYYIFDWRGVDGLAAVFAVEDSEVDFIFF